MNKKGDMFLMLVVSVMGFMFFATLISMWITASVKSRIYNERFHTHYSTSDFLMAEDTITSIVGDGKKNTQNLNIIGLNRSN